MSAVYKLFIVIFVLLILPPKASAAGGDLDKTFGSGGVATTSFPNSSLSEATGVVVQPDGKIVVSAFANGTTGLDIVLIRYNLNGTLDISFDGDGIVTSPLDGDFDLAADIALQADGKILIAGRIGISPSRFVILRYNSDGSPDTTFDDDGIVTTTLLQNSTAKAIAVQSDGKIIVAGNALDNTNRDFFAVARYSPDGSLDSSFGGTGVVFNSFGVIDFLNDLVIQNDGKILTVGIGDAGASTPLLAMIRLNPNGSFDSGFDGDGRVAAQIPFFEEANSVDLQSDGRIIVGGQLNGYFSAFRFNQNGALDKTFDNDGIAIADFEIFSRATDIKTQADGKIVGVGETYGESLEFALARFNSNGSLDKTFGAGGKVTSQISTGDDTLNRMSIQPDGKIIGAGVSGLLGDKKITLARYFGGSLIHASPSFDFDGDGKTDIGVWRALSGSWWYLHSSDLSGHGHSFGLPDDIITPGDFTGDGKADVAIWRPSTGEWFVRRSEDGSYFSYQFGLTGDIPAPADYDGDGITDTATFRPSTATWYIFLSSSGTFGIVTFGLDGDKPVPADYDGDGKADIAVWRPSNATWWIVNSSNLEHRGYGFGTGTDKPVVGDYTGDGKADIAVWRDATREWFFLRSEDGSYYSYPSGLPGDIPAPGDYDGDGKFDSAVFRPSTQTWYIDGSTAGSMIATFGLNSDRPIANAYVP